MEQIRCFKYAIKDNQLIEILDKIHTTLNQEVVSILGNEIIKLDSFAEKELSHAFRGYFKKKLAEMTQKSYKNWDISPSERYFRIMAMHMREVFQSLAVKQKITDIAKKYDWNPNSDEMKEELKKSGVITSSIYLKQICQHKLENVKPEKINIPLDFTHVDSNVIKQNDKLKPEYEIRLNGVWHQCKISIPVFFQNYINKHKMLKISLPKFIKKDNQWFAIISGIFEVTEKKNSRIAGVDIGKVKHIACVVVDTKKQAIVSKEINIQEETLRVKTKIQRIQKDITNINKKLKTDYSEKLKLEKDNLSRKVNVLKKELNLLVARDLSIQLQEYDVSEVNLEQLNWLQNKGGYWDFSKLQEKINNRLSFDGIAVNKVSATHTTTSNPFDKNGERGTINKKRQVVFKEHNIVLDRDYLAAINIACRKDNLIVRKETIISENIN